MRTSYNERRAELLKKTAILLAEGFEEVEALTVVDLLRRADIGCDMVSLEAARVTGSHGIIVTADKTWPEADFEAYDALLLPGGLRGTGRLAAHRRHLRRAYGAGGGRRPEREAGGLLSRYGGQAPGGGRGGLL